MSADMKAAAGPSGIRVGNDWVEVTLDIAYGEWRLSRDDGESEEPHITGARALARAMEILADAARRRP